MAGIFFRQMVCCTNKHLDIKLNISIIKRGGRITVRAAILMGIRSFRAHRRMQMTPQEIMIGTRLELEMLNSSGERIGNVYVSQLLDHQEDGTMVISAPIFGSRVVFIPDGITIRLTFVHQVHGLLGFTAVVNTRGLQGKIAVLTVTPAADIIKIQRRMHYRLEIILTQSFVRQTREAIWKVQALGKHNRRYGNNRRYGKRNRRYGKNR